MPTELLKRAFEEVAKLPEFEQDVLAQALLEMIAAEVGWDEILANSQEKLEQLANRALKTEECDLEPLDPDKL